MRWVPSATARAAFGVEDVLEDGAEGIALDGEGLLLGGLVLLVLLMLM